MTEAKLINHVLSWLADQVEKERFRLQHDFACEFVAMGHGWCDFDLHLWDGSTLFISAWVGREETEITFVNTTRRGIVDKVKIPS
jgi:hypothetical protein